MIISFQSVAMLLYLAVMAAYGFYLSKKVKSTEGWAVADHSLGILPSTGTYFATIVSSTSIISYVGYYYNLGWGGWWNWLGTALTSFLAAVYYAAKLRRTGKMTISDYLDSRFGRLHGTFAAIMIMIGMTFLTCAQIIGGALLLSTATGLSNTVSILIVSIVFIAFTVTGGMFAVAWTDTLSSIIMFVGIWIMALTLLGKVGGVRQLHVTLAESDPTKLDLWAGGKMSIPLALSWFVTWGLGNYGAPQFFTRFCATKDVRTARYSQALCCIAMLLFYLPLMLIGLSGSLLIPGITAQDQVNPILIQNLLHPAVGGLLMAAVLAACISTADSQLLMAGTTFSNDIYFKLINKNATDEQLLKVSRIVAVVVGAASVIASMFMKDVIMLIQANSLTIMASGTCTLVLIGIAWPRANTKGATAAMFGGFITACVWFSLKQPFGLMPLLPAFFVSAILLVAVSLVTEPPKKEQLEEFFSTETISKTIGK